LLHPEIAPNTGNIGRMCAVTGCVLHLVHPLGFKIDDAKLRRAGMDYWHQLDVRHHESWEAFLASPGRPQRLWLAVHAFVGAANTVKIPHFNDLTRSLNLSTACGIATYEALRQVKSK
jgi:tRNA (cytidine/uridine-2'-O-)-methyltransferase